VLRHKSVKLSWGLYGKRLGWEGEKRFAERGMGGSRHDGHFWDAFGRDSGEVGGNRSVAKAGWVRRVSRFGRKFRLSTRVGCFSDCL
jgi:hypothetical protein